MIIDAAGPGLQSLQARLTVKGDKTLDDLIFCQLNDILQGLLYSLDTEKIIALVLGGGYGRGEGGAVSIGGGYAPYNDYDLVLVHQYDRPAELEKQLNRIHREHSLKCNVHVDVTPLHVNRLANLPNALTWYELFKGHIVLYGDQDVLSVLGSRTLDGLPDSEWGRLLFNRGSGLLFSIWLHQGKSCGLGIEESFEQFATRQIEKAWLALGDTWLASQGGYEVQVVNRRKNWLSRGSDVPVWSESYLRSIEFKLSPTVDRSRTEITAELATLADLYRVALKKYYSSEPRPIVGLYATLKYIRPLLWPLSWPIRYPRERMRRALFAELAGDTLTRERLVGSPANYIELWQKYA